MKKLCLLIFLTFFSSPAFASTKVAHVLVALCDNLHQRIYPVPISLGKGGDPEGNLYWGALYGVKTHFRKSKDWILVEEIKNPSENILRRAIFKNKNSDSWMVADAYIGKEIKSTIQDFLEFSSGNNPESILVKYNNKDINLKIGGDANLLAFVGHNGLMDFDLKHSPKGKDDKKREVAILACYSKRYFKEYISNAKATPLIWTNGKMAPEGYVLEAILDSWVLGKTKEETFNETAKAYAKYQKISIKAGRGLFSYE